MTERVKVKLVSDDAAAVEKLRRAHEKRESVDVNGWTYWILSAAEDGDEWTFEVEQIAP